MAKTPDGTLRYFDYIPGQSFRPFLQAALDQRLGAQYEASSKTDYKVHPIIADRLQNIRLLPQDRRYIRVIHALDPDNRQLTEGLAYLLDTASTPLATRKIKERFAQTKVSLDDCLTGFSSAEKGILAENLAFLQLTEGCTVGCSFCGVSAARKVSSSFSLESLVKFGKEVPGKMNRLSTLYYASDPFDWIDGDYTYLDLSPLWGTYTSGVPYMSTSLPLGAEFSVLRFLEANYHLYNQGKDAASVRQIRFSRTSHNAARVDTIFSVLEQRGVSKDFLSTMQINDLTKQDSIRKNGHLIHHPDRDPLADAWGISCQDGVYISPGQGVRAGIVEACTRASPTGLFTGPLEPGRMTIPVERFTGSSEYEHPGTAIYGRLSFSLIPEAEVMEVRNGKITDRHVYPSIRRDIKTFLVALRNLGTLGYPNYGFL